MFQRVDYFLPQFTVSYTINVVNPMSQEASRLVTRLPHRSTRP